MSRPWLQSSSLSLQKDLASYLAPLPTRSPLAEIQQGLNVPRDSDAKCNIARMLWQARCLTHCRQVSSGCTELVVSDASTVCSRQPAATPQCPGTGHVWTMSKSLLLLRLPHLLGLVPAVLHIECQLICIASWQLQGHVGTLLPPHHTAILVAHDVLVLDVHAAASNTMTAHAEVL